MGAHGNAERMHTAQCVDWVLFNDVARDNSSQFNDADDNFFQYEQNYYELRVFDAQSISLARRRIWTLNFNQTPFLIQFDFAIVCLASAIDVHTFEHFAIV